MPVLETPVPEIPGFPCTIPLIRSSEREFLRIANATPLAIPQAA